MRDTQESGSSKVLEFLRSKPGRDVLLCAALALFMLVGLWVFWL